MSHDENPHLAAALAIFPALTPAQEQQAATDLEAAKTRAFLAAKLGVSVDALNTQHFANVKGSVAALALQVQNSGEQRSRIEQALGLQAGSLSTPAGSRSA